MVFYKGALTFKDLKEMPISDILEFNTIANKINDELERESKRK